MWLTRAAAVIRCTGSSGLTLINSILWGNAGPFLQARDDKMPLMSYCDLQEAVAGIGNISVNPLFADAGGWDSKGTPANADDDVWIMGDYHLMTRRGRFRPEYGVWILDEAGSPCIDAGDPRLPLACGAFAQRRTSQYRRLWRDLAGEFLQPVIPAGPAARS